MESILTSIKKMLGIAEEYTHFDADIIMHINSVFMTLTQLGVGPSSGFYIEDETTEWTEFIPDVTKLQAVKSYIYLKVRLLFDPSSLGSATLAAYERQIQELEWRLNIGAEDSSLEYDDDPTINLNSLEATVVNCVKLNVRSKPSSTAAIVTVLDANTKVLVDVSKATEDWYYIFTTSGVQGYCLKTNIQIYL